MYVLEVVLYDLVGFGRRIGKCHAKRFDDSLMGLRRVFSSRCYEWVYAGSSVISATPSHAHSPPEMRHYRLSFEEVGPHLVCPPLKPSLHNSKLHLLGSGVPHLSLARHACCNPPPLPSTAEVTHIVFFTVWFFFFARKPAGSMSDIGRQRVHLLSLTRAPTATTAVALFPRREVRRTDQATARPARPKQKRELRGQLFWRAASASCRGRCAWAARWCSRICRLPKRGSE